MERGNFDAYQHGGESSSSSVQNDEIYQIYEELVGVVQDHYEGLAADDDLSKTTAADAAAAGKGGARTKWNKNGQGGKSSPRAAGAAGSDSDSSDEIGRNPNASPIIGKREKAGAAAEAERAPRPNRMVE